MIATFITPESDVPESLYGTKASWLAWLIKRGFCVPPAIALPACRDIAEILDTEHSISHLKELLSVFINNGKYSVAVRSSATCEDKATSSFAGHFETFTGVFDFTELIDCISKVVQSLNRRAQVVDDCKMGVIIQQFVTAKNSGIVFSSNVLNESKEECTISYTEGAGARVVGGYGGSDLNLSFNNGSWVYEHNTSLINGDQVALIIDIAKSIESELGYPVDLEWCIDEEKQQLHILQCRPVSTFKALQKKIIPVKCSNSSEFPLAAKHSKKVILRLRAEQESVQMSAAYLVTASQLNNLDFSEEIKNINFTNICSALSVVLLQPNLVSGKVMRQFCDVSELGETLSALIRIGLGKSWNVVAIIQEVYDATYTGIIARLGKNFAIDIGHGHFISKGTVPASTFVISDSGAISYKAAVTQRDKMRIIGSSITRENVDGQKVAAIDELLLKHIVRRLAPFLDNDKLSLEFGVVDLNDMHHLVYLIDAIEQKQQAEVVNLSAIQEGIISQGYAEGMLEYVDTHQLSRSSLDRHFHDNLEGQDSESKKIIFVCEHPDIGLLDTISKYHSSDIGFIFQEATILCHLAIVLRERGIPAIRFGDISQVLIGRMAKLDALSTGLTPMERLKYDS